MPSNDSQSSLGERVGAMEKAHAVHEAVCGERYKAIQDGIASLRIEMAQRGARAEMAFKVTTGIIALMIAGVGLAIKAFG